MNVHAPRLWVSTCRNAAEYEFILALHAHAEAADWEAEGFPSADGRFTAAFTVCVDSVVRDIRVDFDGTDLLMGEDETKQYCTDLDPARPDVIRESGKSPAELAAIAANWIERERARPIDRHEWGVLGMNACWILADTGKVIDSRGTNTHRVQPAHRVVRVWPPGSNRPSNAMSILVRVARALRDHFSRHFFR